MRHGAVAVVAPVGGAPLSGRTGRRGVTTTTRTSTASITCSVSGTGWDRPSIPSIICKVSSKDEGCFCVCLSLSFLCVGPCRSISVNSYLATLTSTPNPQPAYTYGDQQQQPATTVATTSTTTTTTTRAVTSPISGTTTSNKTLNQYS